MLTLDLDKKHPYRPKSTETCCVSIHSGSFLQALINDIVQAIVTIDLGIDTKTRANVVNAFDSMNKEHVIISTL